MTFKQWLKKEYSAIDKPKCIEFGQKVWDAAQKAALPSDNKPLTKCSCNNHNIRVMCLGCGGHVEDL